MTQLTLMGPRALTEDGAGVLPDPVDIVIESGEIRAVRPAGSAPPVGEAIDARHTLAVPGFINGHHHSHENFHKGRYDRLPLELWMNYVRPAKPLPLTADDVYLRTLVGASQALLSGTTCIVDDFNASPVLDPEHVEAALAAYEDIGIRALLGPTLFDVPFHESVPFIREECCAETLAGLAPAHATPPDEYLRLVETLAATRHPRENRVGVLLAPSAPQRCSDGFLRRVRELADATELPVIIHVQETRLQAASAWHERGKTLFQHLDELGFLAPGTSLIHAVWLTPDDIARIAASGASVQHNPNSNLKLGSGLMPMRALLDAGVNVSLGTDGCGSLESTDMLRVVANTALLHKLRGDDYRRWIGAEEALEAATLGGARALGLEDRLGRIAPGQRADLVLYRLDAPAFTPLNDPLRQLVFGESGIGIDSVFVEGERVVADGQLTRLDQREIARRIEQAMERLRPAIGEAEQRTETLRPAYERIWTRCQALPLAPGTIAARFDAS
ncbi:amidohydrolase [Halomonas sp. JS92-SW72]|uniref:amidohydrolase family protein n=1 Tax=Halomonas sp. JS92-SW72 TaxID=2306583 RepID=UPI000E5A330C|nr:amidohydrolase [Halomonas sp. JS92-SW72]AXY41655.1 amidohydrolase [Halomonas sp. JS92-SW72]